MTRVLERYPHPKYPRLRVELRSDSRFLQAVTRLDGSLRQFSLKTPDLPTAFKLAESWYKRQLRASAQEARQHPFDKLTQNPLMADVMRAFCAADLPPAKRAYIEVKWSKIKPFWGPLVVTDISPLTFREFYRWRRRMRTPAGTVIRNHTIHKDVMVVRQIMKHAIEEGQLAQLPLIPSVGKIDVRPRPWLDPDEWRHLVTVSEARIVEAANKHQQRVWRQRLDLLEFMQMMVGTMCRVGELLALHYSDCRVDPATQVLTAHVIGKTGARNIKAPADAGRLLVARQARLHATSETLVFPVHHRDGFRELLQAAGLYKDSHGFTRNLKSLRATAISFRVLQGGETPNLLAIARNAGCSANMIDTYYAKRLTSERFADTLSASLDDVVGDSLM